MIKQKVAPALVAGLLGFGAFTGVAAAQETDTGDRIENQANKDDSGKWGLLGLTGLLGLAGLAKRDRSEHRSTMGERERARI